jgi:hypothetical protein
MAPGTYQVYEHNGLGGPYGWVQFQTFVTSPVTTVTIVNPASSPTTTINVAPPNGTTDDASIAAAIAAVPTGGATIQLATGHYVLSKAILLPNNTTLKGVSGTLLFWTKDPMNGSAFLPLISGARVSYNPSTANWLYATFNVEKLGIQGSPTYNGYAIQRAYTLSPGVISNVQINLPLIGTTSTCNATGIWLRQTNDTTITNCLIVARTGIYSCDRVTNTRVEANDLWYRQTPLYLNGNSNNFIVDNNTIELLGNETTNGWGSGDNPGFWFTTFGGFPYFAGAYTENLYYANNQSIHQLPLDSAESRVGMTFDGASGIYFGGVQGVQTSGGVTTVTLNSPTAVVTEPNGSSVPYNYAGAVMKVESGTGTGQWAYIVSASPNSSTVTINQPFQVPLDSTSMVSIVNMQGNAIFDGNTFGCEPCDQDYYFSMDVIKYNNTYSVGGNISWAGVHYNMPFSDWHLQFLDNTITAANASIQTFTTGGMPGYTGPVANDIIYRGNVDQGAASSTIAVRSANGLFGDAVVENNSVATIGLGQGSDPINYNGVVLRTNGNAKYTASKKGTNLGNIPGVVFLP